MENKSKNYFANDRGQAGLTMLLSVVAIVFIIGFLIMIFAIMGSNLSASQYDSTSASFTNKTTATVINSSTTGVAINTVNNSALRECSLSVTTATNTSYYLITSSNYTVTGCLIKATNAVSPVYNNTQWIVNGTYTYNADTTATEIIADTTSALADVPTWFPIIITITVMVSLILLTVIIIVAIKSSGLLQGGN